jgi:hypothetical protein
MVEVRSIKIGELEQAPVYGFTVLGSSGSLVMRINSAAALLKDQDLEMITLDDYRDRLVNLKLAGNQQVDTQEALTSGRKFMLWNIPRTLNNPDLAIVAQEFFGDTFVESEITTSAQCHPYGWFILNAATNELQQHAADFEAVLQAKWGMEITLAMSKTRQQRIRMNATGRERMEQRDSLNKPAGVLKEIMIPAKVIQDAVMESAFLDLWVDQIYTRLGPRIVVDLVAAVEQRVEQMVAERLEAALNIKMEQFSTQVLQKVFSTIDSAVDISISRALEARVICMNGSDDCDQSEEGLMDLLDSVVIPPVKPDPPTTALKPANTSAPAPPSPTPLTTLVSPLSPLDPNYTPPATGNAAPAAGVVQKGEETTKGKRTLGELNSAIDSTVDEVAPKLIRVLADMSNAPPRGLGLSQQATPSGNSTQSHPNNTEQQAPQASEVPPSIDGGANRE